MFLKKIMFTVKKMSGELTGVLLGCPPVAVSRAPVGMSVSL